MTCFSICTRPLTECCNNPASIAETIQDGIFNSRMYQGFSDILYRYRSNWSYKIEKVVKIAYRVIDLVGTYIGPLWKSFVTISSWCKDTALSIESTNFFFLTYPLLIKDQNGKTFFETRNRVQIAESVSLSIHLFFKMFVGAERFGLVKLGIIGSYAIGYVSIYRYLLEGFVYMFNFFGTWDGIRKLSAAKKALKVSQAKIAKWDERLRIISDISLERLTSSSNKWTDAYVAAKQRKWQAKESLQKIDQTKAWFKIAAKVSKMILIGYAVSLMTINYMTVNCLRIILNLGIISDGIGLAACLYSEHKANYVSSLLLLIASPP